MTPTLCSAAQGGTLFLDEIAEVPLPLQAKLLRFLEGREFRPLGSTVNETFTGRFVAATNTSLRAEVQAGRFREDLLFRIEVFALEVPPLRQRREDVPGLSEFLLAQLAKKYGRATPMIKGEDLAALQTYDFPGNVRELRNILERGLLRTGEEDRWLAVDAAWLKAASVSPRSAVAPGNAPSGSPNSAPVAAPALEDSLPPERAGLSPLESQEYRMIRAGLIEARGGIRRAASKLGLSPQALLRRLEKWPELRPPPSAD